MSSPLFNLFGNQQSNMPGPFGNMSNMINQFNQFKNSFKGDSQQQVQELLNSGRMTQQQYNQLSQLATQFQNMMKL